MRMECATPSRLDEARRAGTPLVIPVGVMEYHSAHLPIGTDALVVEAFMEKLERDYGVALVRAPTVWYGPASYAVRGPEGYSIDMDGVVFNQTMHYVFSALLRAGFRRVYAVMFHQTEDFNPTETACLDASRRAIFRYLEETRGIGWWGDMRNAPENDAWADEGDPWNWIRVRPLTFRDPSIEEDHAGEHETSMLWSLCPSLVQTDRIGETQDWFARSAVNASKAHGDALIEKTAALWKAELAR